MTQRVNIWLSAGTPTVAGTRAELKSENIRNLRLQVFQKRQHIQQIILKPDYMEQSPSKASSCSASQEIPCLLWNPKGHYCVHKSLLLVPILNQMTTVHTSPPYFPRIHTNIIYMPNSYVWYHSFRFFNKNTVCISHLSHVYYMPHPSKINKHVNK